MISLDMSSFYSDVQFDEAADYVYGFIEIIAMEIGRPQEGLIQLWSY